ncbi:Uncharacterised protein [Mycobacteroides abscessus subsp. massiliense]|nr:Uncharacterised protein [Mycobacteroides abscessus subsp. massiliense]
MQGPPADVREREHLEHAARQHFFDDRRRRQTFEGVEDGLRPRAHLLALTARQIAQLLTADRVQRPEHHDLAVTAARFTGACLAAQGNDAYRLIEQDVQCHTLFRGAPTQSEDLAVTAHQLHPLLRVDSAKSARGAAE